MLTESKNVFCVVWRIILIQSFKSAKVGLMSIYILTFLEAIQRRELMKVSILNNNLDDPKEIAEAV